MRIGTGPRRKPPVRPQEPHCLLGHDDRGQLLLLAGVILTLAFLVTSLTLLQFRSIERTNALDSLLNLIDERHDVPARLGEALERHTGPTGSAVQFKNTEFPTIAAAGRRELASYGNEGSRLLAAGSIPAFTTAQPPEPGARRATIVSLAPTRAKNDGIIWQNLRLDTPRPTNACMTGILLTARVESTMASIEETILFAVNTS